MANASVRSYNTTPKTDGLLKSLAKSQNTSKSAIIRRAIESEYVRKSGEGDAKK